MHEIGKKLRTAREAKKITIEMLADRTKIYPRYLRNIEEGEWTFLPEPYIHGIVRKFAANVGLDADELLKQHAILMVTKYKDEKKRTADKSAKIRAFRSKILFSRSVRTVFLSLAALTLLLILFFLLLCSASRASRMHQQNIYDLSASRIQNVLPTSSL